MSRRDILAAFLIVGSLTVTLAVVAAGIWAVSR